MKYRKIILALLTPIVVLGIYDITKLMIPILYFVNGSSLKVNGYTINFPFSHWAYFGKSKNGFILSGTRINAVDLAATIHDLHEDIAPALGKLCNNVLHENKQFKRIAFKVHICTAKGGKKNTYFQTMDNNLVIETDTYKEDSRQNILEFKLLLDNVMTLERGKEDLTPTTTSSKSSPTTPTATP